MSRPDEPLVAGGVTFPSDELHWRFGPTGGPGGQHANRSSTRAELTIDLERSPSLPPDTRDRILRRLGPRARGGTVTVVSDDSRSQWRNRVNARRRMAGLLTDALRPAPAPRTATKPSRRVRMRRLAAKRRRSETKRLRRRPADE